MKLAAPYPLKKSRQDIIDEYNIDFIIDKHKTDDLINWLRKPEIKEKRINLKMTAGEKGITIPLETLSLLNDLHPNLYLRLQHEQAELIPNYQEAHLKYFFDYHFNTNSFCRLQEAIDQGVSDVYIIEDLCYRLPQVKNICDKYGVQIRLIANMIPSYTLGKGEDVTSPFYTPENMEQLELYYDVIEFELFNSWNRFDTLYKVWFIDKEWRDDLKFINFELAINIPGGSFPRELCEYKMKCGHRCVERQSSCRKCQQYIELAQSMHRKNIEYTKEKKWVETNYDEPIKDIFDK